MTILGIDPGVARMGYGVLRGMQCMDYGCFETAKTDTAASRLYQIRRSVASLIRNHKPDAVAVEKLFFQTNVKTAMAVSQARGVVLAAAAEAGLPVIEITPLQVKQAITGYGKAEKGQVQRMVKVVLKLDKVPKPDDAADALAIAYTGLIMKKL